MTSGPDEFRRAYDTHAILGPGPRVSDVERALLVDTLVKVGPDAPTLSGDWDAHHLLAHLVLRESNPVGAVKASMPTFGDAPSKSS